MQNTSELYKEILSGYHYTRTKLIIAGKEYGEDAIREIKTISYVFGQNMGIGNCPIGEIKVKMDLPSADIPRMAKMELFVQLTDGERESEWIPKGTYYIDTRKNDNSNLAVIDITGCNAMAFTEGDCPSAGLTFPATDIDIVRCIAAEIGVTVDPETVALMDNGYTLPSVTYYSCREILSYIAGAYAGNFLISDTNQLRLVQLGGEPEEKSYLITSNGDIVTFGGVMVIVE